MIDSTPATTRAPAPEYAVLIGAQLAVGSAAILARAGLQDGLGPVALSAWRLAAASGVLLLYASLRRSRTESGANIPLRSAALLTAAGILLGLHFAAWFASLERIPVARSTLLACTSPVFAGLIGVGFLRQRIPLRFWAGLLVAGMGVLGVTWQSPNGESGVSGPLWVGDLLALIGAASIALYLLMAQRIQHAIGSAQLITWTYSVAAISLWPIALMTDSGRMTPNGVPGWASILGMALIPQLIGHTALNWSLKHFSAAAVGTATLLEPVFAAALARWLFQESVTALQGVSAAVLLAGVAAAITARPPTTDDRRPPEHLKT